MACKAPSRRTGFRAWRGVCAATALGALCALAGCSRSLFSEKETRTQFDRYDRVRNRYAPQYIEDEFGKRQPNLKGRLTPKG